MRKRAKMIMIVFLAFLLILVVVLGTAYWNFNSQIGRETRRLLSGAKSGAGITITQEMLKGLPEPVQRYLAYSGIVGKQIPHTIRLKQVGRIRQDAKSAWMKLEAVEYYSTTPPGFIWKVYMPNRRIPITLGRDAYLAGQGSMLIKMLSLFSMVNAAGSAVDQGAMMRYLNEMAWFPAAFLGENISWKAIDDGSAEVTLTDRGKRVSAILHFHPGGN